MSQLLNSWNIEPLLLVGVTDSYNNDKPGNRHTLTVELLEH